MLNKRTSSEKTWDAIAKSFSLTRSKPWRQCIEFIHTLPNTYTVADLGCGNGRHLLPCAVQCNQVIGIDISLELLNIIKKKVNEKNLTNVYLIHADLIKLPLQNDTMDAVIYIASLHNITGRENRIQSLNEVHRILKSNGKALITVWSRWQDKFRNQFFKKWFTQIGSSEFGDINIYWRQHGLNIPRFYHLYSKREFINDLRNAGFKIMALQDIKLRSEKHPDNYFAFVKKGL